DIVYWNQRKMKKIVVLITSLVVSAMVFWYFFLKSFDYSFKFFTSTAPGTVYFAVKDWSKDMAEKQDSIQSRIVTEELFSKIGQELLTKKGKYIISWSFTGINDSLSSVRIGVKDIEHPFFTRASLLFYNKKTKKDIKDKIQIFKIGL